MEETRFLSSSVLKKKKKQSSFINGPDFPTLLTTGAIKLPSLINHTLYILSYALKGLELLDSLIKCSSTGFYIPLNGYYSDSLNTSV